MTNGTGLGQPTQSLTVRPGQVFEIVWTGRPGGPVLLKMEITATSRSGLDAALLSVDEVGAERHDGAPDAGRIRMIKQQ